MKPRCPLPCLSALLLFLMTGCGLSPHMNYSVVPEETLNQLPKVQLAELRGNSLAFASEPKQNVAVPMFAHLGVPCVRAKVNGRLTRLLVDTGCQNTVIEAQTAVNAQVRTFPRDQVHMTLIGTLGTEKAMVGLPTLVELGAWRLHHLPCIVRTSENHWQSSPWKEIPVGFDSLGMDVVHRTCHYLTFDYPHDEVRFGLGCSFTPPQFGPVWHVPLTFQHGLPYVTLRTDGQEWTALVDTGCNGMIEMDQSLAARLGAMNFARPVLTTRFGVGTADKATKGQDYHTVMMSRLDSLGPPMANIKMLIIQGKTKIGTGLLRRFRVTFDLDRSVLWLEDVG